MVEGKLTHMLYVTLHNIYMHYGVETAGIPTQESKE